MKKHVNTIHSDVMLMCEKCDYKTKCKIRLKEHTQAEHEGKKVCCPQCDFKTTWRKNLKAHIQSKHPSEFLHCDQCPFSTTLQRKLNNHRKIAHAAEQQFMDSLLLTLNSLFDQYYYEETKICRIYIYYYEHPETVGSIFGMCSNIEVSKSTYS